MTNLNELAQQIHQNAKDKGFWDAPRNTGEIFMLIISELAEALEADRKGRWADLVKFQAEYTGNNEQGRDAFVQRIKNTVEDEIADTVIRILDYCAVKNIHLSIEIFKEIDNEEDTKNVGKYLLSIVGSVYYASVSARALDSRENKDDREIITLEIHEALAKLFGFAKSNNFDLMQHIELKMKYNATREHKHGKAY